MHHRLRGSHWHNGSSGVRCWYFIRQVSSWQAAELIVGPGLTFDFSTSCTKHRLGLWTGLYLATFRLSWVFCSKRSLLDRSWHTLLTWKQQLISTWTDIISVRTHWCIIDELEIDLWCWRILVCSSGAVMTDQATSNFTSNSDHSCQAIETFT